MTKFRVLLIDDDQAYCDNFKLITQGIFQVNYLLDGNSAIEYLNKKRPDIIFLDYWLKARITGLDVLKEIRKVDANIPVIMISEKTSVDVAVEAIKLGAYHYTSKYGCVKELLAIVEQQIDRLKERIICERQVKEQYESLLGHTPAMRTLKETISKIAKSNGNVLITGETGTGKELIAWEIHKQSLRHKKPFIVINSSAIPDNLFESELFGHRKGAFTGAYQDHIGRFELANKGTIFLDEIGTVPFHLQAKLLRVLDTKTIQRIGDSREMAVDVRILAATNEKLQNAVKSQNFREDLFHRLNVLRIHVPTLQERKDDIPIIANHYLKRFCIQDNKDLKEFTNDQIEWLQNYSWPGNIRELKNIIERFVILED
jgi:DNA-binding NtrC family response regulator